METINYNITVSIVQGPSLSSNGELKSDACSKIGIILPSKTYRNIDLLPDSINEVDFLSIKADRYPPMGSTTLYYRIGRLNDEGSPEVQEGIKQQIASKSAEAIQGSAVMIMHNDHMFIGRSVVHILGKNLNTLTFFNAGDEAVNIEILICYNI